MRKSTLLSPDMLDIYLWHSQIAISLLQIFVTALIFYLAYKKLNYYIKLFDRDDLKGMGELQKEIDIYNKTSGGYAIRIKQSKVLNEVLGLDDFRELVAKLYGIAKV